MTAPAWADLPQHVVVADTPLHSGAAVDAIRGNLARAYQEQVYDSCSYPFELAKLTHVFVAKDVWEHVDEFSAVVIPVRVGLSGSWKTLTIELEGETDDPAASIDVRIYLMPAFDSPPTFSALGAIAGVPYAGFTFSTTAFVWKSATLSPEVVGLAQGPVNGPMGPSRPYPIGYLIMLALTDTAGTSLMTRGLRIREIAEVTS